MSACYKKNGNAAYQDLRSRLDNLRCQQIVHEALICAAVKEPGTHAYQQEYAGKLYTSRVNYLRHYFQKIEEHRGSPPNKIILPHGRKHTVFFRNTAFVITQTVNPTRKMADIISAIDPDFKKNSEELAELTHTRHTPFAQSCFSGPIRPSLHYVIHPLQNYKPTA